MPNSDEHIPATPTAVSETKRRAKQNTRPRHRRRIAVVILMVTGIAAGGWYFGRPYLLVREAKSILANDPQKAASLLEQVVASQGDSFPDANVLWSRALLRSGRWEEALGCFSQIKKPQLADASELLNLAEDAKVAHVNLLTIMAFEGISHDRPERSAALEGLISIRKQAGDLNGTLLLATELSTLQPENPTPWLVMGQVHERMLALPDAAEDFRKFLARAKDSAQRTEALRSLVRVLIQLGDRNEARIYQNELTQKNAGQIQNYEVEINEARLRRLEGNIKGAMDQTNILLSQDKENVAALELRGTLFMDAGDYQAAVVDFKQIVRKAPWNKQAHYKLAQVLTKLGETTAAEFHFKENRRLLQLSNRILELQSTRVLNAEQTLELIHAYEQTGMKSMANNLRQKR